MLFILYNIHFKAPTCKNLAYIIYIYSRYIWPWGKKKAYAHDSYTCKQFSYTHSFPTKRLLGVGNYVGRIKYFLCSCALLVLWDKMFCFWSF